MNANDDALVHEAVEATRKARATAETRDDWKYMGYVGAALLTDQDTTYTGINISLYCGIGFCAEHSAIAEMVKNGETRIKTIVAMTADKDYLPPCGRCREMIYQIDASNLDTQVIIADGKKVPLRELLPYNWQDQIGIELD